MEPRGQAAWARTFIPLRKRRKFIWTSWSTKKKASWSSTGMRWKNYFPPDFWMIYSMPTSGCCWIWLLDDSAWQRTLAENARRLIPEKQMALRDAANDTTAPITGGLLHTHFLRQVAERPDQLAVITPTRRLTYSEIYGYACRIEQDLLRCGVKAE